jgi:hypothetical protein
MDVIFYLVLALFIAAIFCYGVFAVKISLQHQQINAVEKSMEAYGTPQQRVAEMEVITYKKKIDDFATLLAAHRITSNVFSFIEENTVPNVWFTNFSMLETQNEVDISGQTDTLATLSHQVSVFEKNQSYVRDISIFTFQNLSQGKIAFTLKIFFNPNIFNYYSNGFFGPTTSSTAATNPQTSTTSNSPVAPNTSQPVNNK